MKEIKICWLFNDLLDLYGDSGNLRILEYYLKEKEIPYSITEKGLYDEICFTDYDFVYCGPGKLKNLKEAAKRLNQKKESLMEAIEKEVFFLFSGSSCILLGKELKDAKGEVTPCVGLFDYSATDQDKVMIEDVFTTLPFSDRKVYGFINRTATLDNENEQSRKEGFIYKNVFASWLLGPLLVKNPDLLAYYFKKLTGTELDLSNTLEEKAYRETMKEL